MKKIHIFFLCASLIASMQTLCMKYLILGYAAYTTGKELVNAGQTCYQCYTLISDGIRAAKKRWDPLGYVSTEGRDKIAEIAITYAQTAQNLNDLKKLECFELHRNGSTLELENELAQKGLIKNGCNIMQQLNHCAQYGEQLILREEILPEHAIRNIKKSREALNVISQHLEAFHNQRAHPHLVPPPRNPAYLPQAAPIAPKE